MSVTAPAKRRRSSTASSGHKRKSTFFKEWLNIIRRQEEASVVRLLADDVTVSSTLSSHINERDPVSFPTSSQYTGEWDSLDMAGNGIYTMPHGSSFEGGMKNGEFHGHGELRFPNGAKTVGCWKNGRLLDCWKDGKSGKHRGTSFVFIDGLTYKDQDWRYCIRPDRRYFHEQLHGLGPACSSYNLARTALAPVLPPGCYDTGDGIYNPRTNCVTSVDTGNIIR